MISATEADHSASRIGGLAGSHLSEQHKNPRTLLALEGHKSNPEFWARKFELNHERDARKRRQLEDADWQVFEIWECDIRDRLDGVVVEISTTLSQELG